MQKTILITGSTDGIGLLTAKKLAAKGHLVLLHGRSAKKLDAAAAEIGGKTERYLADLSKMSEVNDLAKAITKNHNSLDVLINNAGILKTPKSMTDGGLDVRFMVNTIAPYALTRSLLPLMTKQGRVINLSSAAQAPVNLQALAGKVQLDDMGAYAQSKLAITIWSQEMAAEMPDGPMFLAVNPGSLLASKMVKEGFGIAGSDLNIGADLLCRTALDKEFADATGRYFDNDAGRFGDPHPMAHDETHRRNVMNAIEHLAKSAA